MCLLVREGTGYVLSSAMDAPARSERGDRLTRLRWRVRGAWQWPAFVLLTLADAALLHWLPLAGEGTGGFRRSCSRAA